MNALYNFIMQLGWRLLPLGAVFSSKIKIFYTGRQKKTISYLSQKIDPNDKVIWMHCASLGEFEQGRPVIEKLRKNYPKYKILLSFFSPSGYEIRKDYQGADAVVYAPWDTRQQVQRFLDFAHPNIAIFVKYELWHNLLQGLHRRKIPTILISAILRPQQRFFKYNFNWFKEPLKAFEHFFVQDINSQKLLQSIDFKNVSIAGDTRFDRVYELAQNPKEYPLVKKFIAENQVVVAGSTWFPDEKLLVNFINQSNHKKVKYIIAPHNINLTDLENLKRKISVSATFLSDLNVQNAKESKVLLVDSIGHLSSLYQYGTLAYIGGGFGVGIHNILEAVTYGLPIVFGTNYQKFKEAQDLINEGVAVSIEDTTSLNDALNLWLSSKQIVAELKIKAKSYVADNQGASNKIVQHIEQLLR
jgi:3-deoxy-D-manno-octulosonic-acid transferase